MWLLRKEGGKMSSFSVTHIFKQPVAQDLQNKRLYIWLRRGIYRKAGKIYGWRGAGVGVSKQILLYAERHNFALAVICGGVLDRYYLAKTSASALFALCAKHRSFEKREGVEICVLPFNAELFTTVRDQQTVLDIVKAFGERECGK